MKFFDTDEVGFVADQLGEAGRALDARNSGLVASILLALEAEAPDAGALAEVLSFGAVRLVERLRASASFSPEVWFRVSRLRGENRVGRAVRGLSPERSGGLTRPVFGRVDWSRAVRHARLPRGRETRNQTGSPSPHSTTLDLEVTCDLQPLG
jgi:hypothetical protein